MADVFDSREYWLIGKHYEGKTAERSGLPYIKHINDGIKILESIGSSDETKRAFALHPITQDDKQFREFMDTTVRNLKLDPYIVALAVEYRSVSNSYLSKHYQGPFDRIPLSPILEVNEMLFVDKAQNYRDFVVHHAETHPQAADLEGYFMNWMTALIIELGPRTASFDLQDQA